jgi:enoyl-CoA hydratase
MTAANGELGSAPENVEVQTREDGVAIVTLSRPKALNALDSDTLSNVAAAFTRCDADPSVRAVVLKGAGDRAFSAGGDIKHMANMSPAQFYEYNMRFAGAINAIAKARVPVIAAVQGYAFGGGWSVAQACDLVLASERASFGMQEIEVGLFGGAEFLAAIVGKYRAAEILLLGERMTAERAAELGMVNRVVPHEHLEAAALEWAIRLAAKPPTAVRFAKKVLRMSLTLSPTDIGELQAPMMALCFDTEEQRAAMAATGDRSRS